MTPLPITSFSLPQYLALMGGLAVFSGIIVRLMITLRVPDFPDPRKAHSSTTPKAGGVGIVLAFLLGISLLYFCGHAHWLANPCFMGITGAAVMIAMVSLLDDIKNMSFSVKLAGQVVGAIIAVGSGLWIHNITVPHYGVLNLGWTGIPFTLAFLLFVTNAMNFIDGLNGLAGGVTLIACLFLTAIARFLGDFFVYTVSAILAAGVLGFLPFNFPKGRIFMGDVGSQFCGFLLAILGIAISRFQHVPMSFLLVPFLLFGVMYDVAFTLIRRVFAGENLARAHNAHLYQIVYRAGMPASYVTMVHWLFVILGGITAIIFAFAPQQHHRLIGFLPVIIQLIWTIYVIYRARKAGISYWGKTI